MGFTNPFTAKHDPNLSTQEITELMHEPVTIPPLPTYDPEIHTLIDGTVIEVDVTGAQRLSNGKAIVETQKLAGYLRTVEAMAALERRLNTVSDNFRAFLVQLWESGLDQDTLSEIFGEHELPVARKKFVFSGKVEVEVYGVVGYGKDADEAWENVESGDWEEALNDGNYNTYSMTEPYSYDEAEPDEDDTEDPDFSRVSIFDIQ